MAKLLATDDAVFTAADNLVAAGLAPTLNAILALTGGSFSTIRRALERWKTARESERQAPLPDVVASKTRAFACNLWVLAREEAEIAAQGARLSAAAEADTLRADLDAAHTEIARLEAECERQTTLLDQTQAHLAESTRREASQRERHQWLETRLGDALASRDTDRTQVRRLERELAALEGRCSLLDEQHRNLLQVMSGWRTPGSSADAACGQEPVPVQKGAGAPVSRSD
jgi:hypothetical protein